jgi:hypothetical protein
MAKKVRPRGRGRPATTGKGALVGLRCHPPFLKAVDTWREREDDKPSRPAAIVRLAEIGLATSGATGRTSAKAASKASDMAGAEIDRLVDQSIPHEERASRKRRLLKGPKEFREIREDHPKK